MDYLNECFINWELSDKDCDLFVDTVKIGLEDASVRAREIARTLYLNIFLQYPKKTEKIKSAISKPLQAKLTQYETDCQIEHGLLKDTSEDDLTSSIDQLNNQVVNKNSEIMNTIRKPIIDHETPAVKKSSVTKLHPPPNQSSTVITATPMPPIPPLDELIVPMAKLSVTRSSSEEQAALSIQATVRGAMTRRR